MYDGRNTDFEPDQYERLPRFHGEIPPSACAMLVFTANASKPRPKYQKDNNMEDYDTFASLNILAAVYVQAPDAHKRKVKTNFPNDALGVTFPVDEIN